MKALTALVLAGTRAGGDPLGVHASPIITDHDPHAPAVARNVDGEPAGFQFAGGQARRCRLDAMINGVAHQMSEGILQAAEQQAIQLHLLAPHFNLHGLAEFAGDGPAVHV